MTEPRRPDQPQQPDNNPQPTIPNQYSFLWLSAAIFLMVLWMQGANQPQQQEVAYSEFKEAVMAGQVEEVTLRPQTEDAQLLPMLEEQQVTIRGARSGRPWWQELILGVVPWILLLALLFWFWGNAQKRMAQGGGVLD